MRDESLLNMLIEGWDAVSDIEREIRASTDGLPDDDRLQRIDRALRPLANSAAELQLTKLVSALETVSRLITHTEPPTSRGPSLEFAIEPIKQHLAWLEATGEEAPDGKFEPSLETDTDRSKRAGKPEGDESDAEEDATAEFAGELAEQSPDAVEPAITRDDARESDAVDSPVLMGDAPSEPFIDATAIEAVDHAETPADPVSERLFDDPGLDIYEIEPLFDEQVEARDKRDGSNAGETALDMFAALVAQLSALRDRLLSLSDEFCDERFDEPLVQLDDVTQMLEELAESLLAESPAAQKCDEPAEPSAEDFASDFADEHHLQLESIEADGLTPNEPIAEDAEAEDAEDDDRGPSLPIETGAAAAQRQIAIRPPRRVVVIAGSLFQRQLLRATLETIGCDVTTATCLDAATALEDEAASWEAVVCDGTAAESFQDTEQRDMSELPNLPIVVVGTRGDCAVENLPRAVFLPKFSSRELLSAIEDLCGDTPEGQRRTA